MLQPKEESNMANKPTTHLMYSQCVQALLEPVNQHQIEWYENHCVEDLKRFLMDYATVGVTGSRQTGLSSWFAGEVIQDENAIGFVLSDDDIKPIYSSRDFNGALIKDYHATPEQEDRRGLSYKLLMKFKTPPEINGHVNQYHHNPESPNIISLPLLNRGKAVKKIYILNARKFFEKVRHNKFYSWLAASATPDLRIVLVN